MPIPTTAAIARPGANTFSWEPILLDEPGPDEVLVKLVATGLCHTDLSVLAGRLPTPLPAILGHEGAGIVEAVGPGTQNLQPGDRVVLSFNSCGRCARCRIGQPTRCDTYFPRNFGAARPDGSSPARTADGTPVGALFFGQSSLARHAVVSAHSVVRVQPRDDRELALLAPVGCGVQTGAGAVLNLLQPGPGDTLAVFGAGAVGLSAVMAARLSATATVIAADRVRSRLDLATELGATHTIDTGTEDLGKRLVDITGGRGVTYIVETTGVPALLELAATAITAYGTVAVVGAPAAGSRASFDVNALIDGRTIRGVTEGGSDRITFIPALIDLFRQGRLPYDRFVELYPVQRLDQAVDDARSGRTIKPVVVFDDEPSEANR
ncbi:NAD(P)-dependent alcohol dehydrogenase [Actinoplanes derwentensis]|uniref:Aryl-alcohol dehydrogenase n=1 Tax=Actinoplanes derwentensis TaxID=113562 RepID=A0A1H2DC62_9ACTN|nr:NAD(P)-dependent alcohol dehydrogenase [Actinoplanes derwentensis]GID90471.1 alcohol dehydrogenase [Actinoplanes derwentensis]SDT80338.1 aryl-alcohol dehydrogenase [Actinoplanes derwentensis]